MIIIIARLFPIIRRGSNRSRLNSLYGFCWCKARKKAYLLFLLCAELLMMSMRLYLLTRTKANYFKNEWSFKRHVLVVVILLLYCSSFNYLRSWIIFNFLCFHLGVWPK